VQDGCLHGTRGDVDDAPELPRYHALQRRLDHLERRHHVRVHRFQPVLARELEEVAAGLAAGVVDEDVGGRAGGERGGAPRLRGDVGGHRDYFHPVQLANLRRRLLQGFFAAGDDHQVNALGGEGVGAASAESLARGADDGAAAAYAQIHVAPPSGYWGLMPASRTTADHLATSAAIVLPKLRGAAQRQAQVLRRASPRAAMIG
jgi:hypothetical protein